MPEFCGTISRSEQTQWPGPPHKRPDGYLLPLPAADVDSATRFLEGLGGDAAGAGRAMANIGVNAPLLRMTYKHDIENMVAEIARRLKAGQSKETVARWASAERGRIVNRIRLGSGMVTRGIYEIRDWREYGAGGRTWANIEQRYERRGLSGGAMHDEIIASAQRSNPTVNNAAMRGASYLKHGGRVVLVVGVAVSAARIWNAAEHELPRVIGEELGGVVGGGLGAGAGVGICMIFGIASGGWGLLACGVIGGLGGGIAGSHAGGWVADGLYYSDVHTPAHLMGQVTIEIPRHQLFNAPPGTLCAPSR